MKRLISFVLTLTICLAVFVPASANPFLVSYTTYDVTYDAIIKMYIRVLSAGGSDSSRHDLFNTKMIEYDMDTLYAVIWQ